MVPIYVEVDELKTKLLRIIPFSSVSIFIYLTVYEVASLAMVLFKDSVSVMLNSILMSRVTVEL